MKCVIGSSLGELRDCHTKLKSGEEKGKYHVITLI